MYLLSRLLVISNTQCFQPQSVLNLYVGQYIALMRLKGEDNILRKSADIVIINLISAVEKVASYSYAWDTQLGAQIQWGRKDYQLFFNDMRMINEDSNKAKYLIHHGNFTAFGVKLDIFTGRKKLLHCPIYHVSPDGTLAISPNLFKIKRTQSGR